MLLWLMPPGMVFDHSWLCLPGKGEGKHTQWQDYHFAPDKRMITKTMMVDREDLQLNVGCEP